MFMRVSFLLASRVLAGQNIRIGGLQDTILKKLNGARLRIPVADTVETNAIGRGVTAETASL